MKAKNILSLNHKEALDFLMKSDQYDDMKEKRDIIEKVYERLCALPNSEYNQQWLQNITYTQDKKRKKSPYTLRLCQLVMGNSEKPLWNNEWLKSGIVENIPYDSIVDNETLKKVTPMVTFREARAYMENYSNKFENYIS